MKFTESGTELEVDSVFHFSRSLVTLILFAPLRFFVEISNKIVFLKKELVSKILLTACAIALLFILLFSGVMLYFGQFTLTQSSFPLLVPVSSLVILVIGYFLYNSVELVIYDQLNKMFPATKKENRYEDDSWYAEDTGDTDSESLLDDDSSVAPVNTVSREPTDYESVDKYNSDIDFSNEPLSEPEPEGEGSDVINALLNKAAVGTTAVGTTAVGEAPKAPKAPEQLQDTDDVEDAGNVDNTEVFSKQVIELKNRAEKRVDEISRIPTMYTGEMTPDNLAKFSAELEKCTDPSKYIDDELIAHFTKQSMKDDTQFIADLNLGIIPSTFSIIS